MARYRKYKNGIVGHKYKGYYITKEIENNKTIHAFMDEEKNIVKSGLDDYWDCEWEIDKLTSSTHVMSILKSLYNEEIYTLNKMYVDLSEKKEKIPEEEELLEWVTKIRNRKADKKPF